MTGPKDLKYPPLATIRTPEITTATLANGIRISLMEDHELPIINGVALVHAGTALDPPARIGLGYITGALLRTGGTASKTPDQLDNLLETISGKIDSFAEETYTRIGFSGLRESGDELLALLKDVLTEPEFRQDKLEAVRAQVRTAIASRNQDPVQIASREFTGLVFGNDSPFGWLPQYDTVDRITRAEIRAYYRRYFVPANVTLALSGDFKTAEMKDSLEKLFASWKLPAQPAPEFPKVKDAPAHGLYLATRKEGTDTYFAIGHLGGRGADKDLAALQVMASVLNGPRGRLSAAARARTGATHQIQAAWIPGGDHPGLFQISGSTRTIQAQDVIRLILAEIEKIRTAEITEEELRTAREAQINALVFRFDSRAKLFANQVNYDLLGYPKDYLQQYQKSLQAVTRAEVLRVAKQHVDPARLTVVLVANPQNFSDPLEKLGMPVTPIDLTIPEAHPESVPTSDTSLAEGKQLLQKAQAAMGGAEKMATVKDFTSVAVYQLDPILPTIGGSKLTETDRWVAPMFFRQETVVPAGRVAAYTDGKLGWIQTPQGWGALQGTQLKQVQGDLFRTWFRLMLSDRIEGRTVNGVDANSIQVTDTTGQEVKIEFDPTSGLPTRVSYDTQQAIGAPLYTEDMYEDYRDVNGFKLPFKVTINQGGRKFADVTVSSYELNSGLKTTDLSRRPL